MIRAALLLTSCDLVAIRALVGCHGHSSHQFPCLACPATVHSWEDVEYQPLHPPNHHRPISDLHREALSKPDKDRIYKLLGAQESILHSLPSYDLARCTPPDGLHQISLGIIETHCNKVLGMDPSSLDGNAVELAPKARETMLAAALQALQTGDGLENIPTQELYYLCWSKALRRGRQTTSYLQEQLRNAELVSNNFHISARTCYQPSSTFSTLLSRR